MLWFVMPTRLYLYTHPFAFTFHLSVVDESTNNPKCKKQNKDWKNLWNHCERTQKLFDIESVCVCVCVCASVDMWIPHTQMLSLKWLTRVMQSRFGSDKYIDDCIKFCYLFYNNSSNKFHLHFAAWRCSGQPISTRPTTFYVSSMQL